jgi:thiosulfate/3-mercaptopyruvate sulfurtransferase
MHRSWKCLAAALALPLSLATLFAGCGGAESPSVGDQEAAGSATASADAQTAANADASPSAEAESSPQSLGLIIGVDELQARLGEEGLRILDARRKSDYEAGHIPGAVPVDVDRWKSQSLADGGLHDAHAWAGLVGELGIDAQSNVVVYAVNPTDAARIWWTLKYVGVEQAAVLDGGWSHWKAAEAEISQDPAEVEPAEFLPVFQPERLAEIGDLKQSLGSENWIVVDARSIEEYTGTGGPGTRKGRIPAAKHIEWKELLAEDGRFKSPDELRSLFEERGVDPARTAVTHCQSGGRAALDALALELAGFEKVKNYYCGWQEWSGDSEAPVETSQPPE